MKFANDLIPWKVTDISLRPYKDFFSFNGSIHFDGETWRCILRCADYCMKNGVTVRSRKARGGVRTKNAMVIFDPKGWKPVEIYKMHERDDHPRSDSSNVGYEDIRLFQTDRSGLQGIAASQHLRRSDRSSKLLPEQVLISFDDHYDIVAAHPIRGGSGSWSDISQKNWVPVDQCVDPRFIYSIATGALFDERGALDSRNARIKPSTRRAVSIASSDRERRRAQERAIEAEDDRDNRDDEERRHRRREDPPSFGTVVPAPGYDGLRGGTQLVYVGNDAWLGIGHAMQFVGKFKHYHHVWYLVDGTGKLTAASEPMKLAPEGIEFAAGLAIDGDRVVVSFGVDDFECRLAETKLSAVMGILKSVSIR